MVPDRPRDTAVGSDKEAVFMPPTLTGYIGFGLSVRVFIRACVRSSRTVHARILKFHIWIPHGKNS